MNIDTCFAASLTDSELIRYLESSRSELTDTPAETELLKRLDYAARFSALGQMADAYRLETTDIEVLANALIGDAAHTARLLEELIAADATKPARLAEDLALAAAFRELAATGAHEFQTLAELANKYQE